jgi:hypothetical protein
MQNLWSRTTSFFCLQTSFANCPLRGCVFAIFQCQQDFEDGACDYGEDCFETRICFPPIIRADADMKRLSICIENNDRRINQ